MSTLSEEYICLFCNERNSASFTAKDLSCAIKKFIKLLQRFIDDSSNGNTFLVEKLLENEFSNKLNLCEECSSAVDQFCELFHELKCLEMKLEWKLGGLINGIELGDELPAGTLNFDKSLQKTFENKQPNNFDDRTLLKMFRQSIIQAGQRMLKLSTPRVLLKRKPDNYNGQPSAQDKLLSVYAQNIIDEPVTRCQKSATDIYNLNDDDDLNEETALEKVKAKIDEIRNIESIQSQDGSIQPSNLLPQFYDGNQFLNDDLEITHEDQESCASENYETFEESATVKTEQASLVHEIFLNQQDISFLPGPGSLPIENLISTNTTTSCGRDSIATNNCEIDYAQMPESTFVKTEINAQNQACKETSLKINEPSSHLKSDVIYKSYSNQRYNLRKIQKPKSPIIDESSSDDDDNQDDNQHITNTLRYSSSSETTSDSEDDNVKFRLRNRSKKYYALEVTSKSENSEKDVKPLQHELVRQSDNISVNIIKSKQLKQKLLTKSSNHPNPNKVLTEFKTLSQTRKKRRPKSGFSSLKKEKPVFKCLMDGCQKYFRNEQIYHKHIRLHIPGQFKCEFCENVEDSLIQLSFHEYRTHSKVKAESRSRGRHPWNCPRCMHVAKSSLSYQTHFANVHFQVFVEQYSDMPMKDVITKIGSERHGKFLTEKQHDSEPETDKLYKCFSDGCTKIFYAEKIYQNHRKLHENGEFQCAACDIKETNLIRLSNHEYRRHTSDERQKEDSIKPPIKDHSWKCPRCFIELRRLIDYQAHFAFVHFGVGDDPNQLKVKLKSKLPKERKMKLQKLMREEINGVVGYRCQVCKIPFSNKAKLRRHNRKTHRSMELMGEDDHQSSKTESDVKLKCYFCEDTFEYAPDLAIHETKHATQIFTQLKGQKQPNAQRKKLQCPRCPFKYNVRAAYIKHHWINHQNTLANNLPGACSMCSGSKIYIPNSTHHFNRLHNKNLLEDPSKIFECDECPAYFVQPFQLLMHQQKIHHQNLHKCKFCEKKFTKKTNLKIHLNSVHKCSDEDPKLPLGCDSEGCNKRFSSLGELDLHKRFHKNIENNKQRSKGDSTVCAECGKVCKSKAALSVHKSVQHSKQMFVCAECGKGCKTKNVLETHMMYHQSPNQWKFECGECGKKCVDKWKLEAHKRTHTKEKPFVCQFCGEKYAHRHNWKNHLKTKHGDEEETQMHIARTNTKFAGGSYMSRKGSKKGDCIIAGETTNK